MSNSIAYVSAQEPCPLCGKPSWCSIRKNEDFLVDLVICGRTETAPDGWEELPKRSSDNRKMFVPKGMAKKYKHMPRFQSLQTSKKSDIPQWNPVQKTLDHLNPGDLVFVRHQKKPKQLKKILAANKKGLRALIGDYKYEKVGGQEIFFRDIKSIAHTDGKEKEQAIEYPYTRADGTPIGKVVRQQWSDRRPVYEQNRKSKRIRPYHWDSAKQTWIEGKGSHDWPLYREGEVAQALAEGGIVFYVGGEKCVEAYRSLGLTATTNVSGEGNWGKTLDLLSNWIIDARKGGIKPLIVLHPDHDITGENQFKALHTELRNRKIPVICLNPLALWPHCPHGGDIAEWLETGMDPTDVIKSLEIQIKERLDREEQWTEARHQLDAWNPPISHRGELGYWNKCKETGFKSFNALADFDFDIERELDSPEGGGLLLNLKRADDKHPLRVFVENTAFDSAQKFSTALKKAVCGAVATRMGNTTVQALLRAKLHHYRHDREGKRYRMVTRAAQQEDGAWVFPTLQLDKNGYPTTEDKTLWCWYTSIVQGESMLPLPKVTQPNHQILGQLLQTMHRAFGPENIHHAVLTLGYAAAAVNRQAIMKNDGSFPIHSLYGDPGSGKTTMAECALAVVGMGEQGMFSQISFPAMFEKLKLCGSLLYCLDDPTRDPEMDETLKRLYNGEPRVVKGKDNQGFNSQKPHSALMLTSNSALGEHSQAARSRMVRLFVGKRTDGDRHAFVELRKLCRQAGGALPTLIQFGHDSQAISDLEERFRPLMIHAQARIPKSLAIVTHYAKLVCQAGDLPLDIEQWVRETLCPEFNDVDEGGDSLRDFFEKLSALRSEALIGGWNYRYICHNNTNEVQGLALYMASIWPVMDKQFALAYDKKIVSRLLGDEGCQTNSVQKFHENKDVSIALSRIGQKEKIPTQPKKCILVPIEVLKKFSEMGVTGVTGVTEESKIAEKPENKGEERLPIFNSNLVTDIDIQVTAPANSNGHSPVTFSPDPGYLPQVTEQVTAQSNTQQGLDEFGYPVTSVTPQKGSIQNQSAGEWVSYADGDRPTEGDKVRIIAGESAGKEGVIFKVHAVQATVKVGDGSKTIVKIANLEVWSDVE